MATYPPVPRAGTSWDLILRNVVLDEAVVDGDTASTTVAYALTHNGTAYQSGSLTWEANGHEDAWAVRFLLPSTAGVLVAVVTVTVGTAVGELRSSLKVEA